MVLSHESSDSINSITNTALVTCGFLVQLAIAFIIFFITSPTTSRTSPGGGYSYLYCSYITIVVAEQKCLT